MKKIEIQPTFLKPITDLYFGDLILDSDLLSNLNNRCNRIIILADLVLQGLAEKLASQLNARVELIVANENAKTLSAAEQIQDIFFRANYGRDTTLIVIGGGVAMDLAGFVASTYMRGIDLILIPSTLLAMVDAAIGGKTAVDTPFGKNLVGTIYFPRAIIADPMILRTLPKREWFNGVAEILKIGLVYDASIFDLAENEVCHARPETWNFQAARGIKSNSAILKAILAKIEIIQKDPQEKGLRRLLNFGHTIGHGIELISHFEISHGEAVAMGCCAESYMSMNLGYLSKDEFERVQAAYRSFTLKLPRTYDRKELIEAMTHDKKNAGGQIRFVIIDRIGHAMEFNGNYCCPITQQKMTETLDWMEKTYG